MSNKPQMCHYELSSSFQIIIIVKLFCKFFLLFGSQNRDILNGIIANHSGKKIGDLYNAFTEQGGEMSYKSFSRRINKLSEGKYISTEKVSGTAGNTTIVSYSSVKKLTDF